VGNWVKQALMPRPFAQASTSSPPVVQRACAKCEEEPVARFAEDDRIPGRVPPIVGEVNRSGGRPLDVGVRAGFEATLGWSFANVRVHADDQAAQAASAVNARAYTSGNHLVFGRGQFDPGSASGDRLLAHELAHVVQQSTGAVPPGISRPGDASEQEADRLADSIVSAGSPQRAGAEANRSGNLWSASDGGPRVHSGASVADHVVQRWPGDGMVPPGDCGWAQYLALRGAVEAAKAVVNALGACTPIDTCPVLAGKIAAITTEIAARVALDTTCFKGGDTGHRQQVQDRLGMLNRCYRWFTGMNCAAELAAAAATAAAAAKAAADAQAPAEVAAEAEEAGTAATELIEGAAGAGEAVEGGVSLLEVLEVVGAVLAL
jgi:hypothetical protein